MFDMWFIIGIIILICKFNALSKENKNLRLELKLKKNFCPKCGYNLNDDNVPNNCFHEDTNNLIKKENDDFKGNDCLKDIYEDEKNYDSQELKNNLILICGSILIVISALVFLTSTWYVTNNFLKIIVIVLMLGVFMGASYVADKVFQLKQTSRAFYYLALAYVPILLLAMALFSLFGKYLSLYGLGRYIYLTVCSFIVSYIYYCSAMKNKNKIIFIGSIIFQMLGIVFGVLIFSKNISIIIAMLCIYNLVLIFSYVKNKYYFDKTLHLKFISVLTIVLGIAFINYIIDFSFSLGDLITEIVLFVSVYYMLIKIGKRENIYSYIYPIFVIFIFYSIACVIDGGFLVIQVMLIFSFVSIYLYEYLNSNSIKFVSYVEVISCFSLLFVITCLIEAFESAMTIFNFGNYVFNGLSSYVVLLMFLLLNIFSYIVSNKNKMVYGFVVIISFIIELFLIFTKFNLSIVLLGYVLVLLLGISVFGKFLSNNLREPLLIIGNISFWLLTLILVFVKSETILLLLLFLIYFVFNIYLKIKRDDEIFKIIGYIYLDILGIKFVNSYNLLGMDLIYLSLFTTLFIVLFECLIPKLRDKVSDVYIIFKFMLLFLILGFEQIHFFLFIIMTVIFGVYLKYYKNSIKFMYVPVIKFILYAFNSDLFVSSGFNYVYLINILILLGLISLIYYTNDNKKFYISLFCIFGILQMIVVPDIKYFNILLLIVGNSVIALKEKNYKDIFKFILYILVFVLYNYIIIDLNLKTISALSGGSYLVLLMALTRGFVSKYNEDYKMLEYVGSGIINWVALFCYTSEFDGIIYVIFLTLLVIVGYVKKYGPLFLMCLLSILLNVFILTREFWYSIPWWLYILLVGSVLIGFSIYNEVSLKKNDSLKDKTFKFMKDLDL